MYSYSWGEPADLRKREVRTCEKREMSVYKFTTHCERIRGRADSHLITSKTVGCKDKVYRTQYVCCTFLYNVLVIFSAPGSYNPDKRRNGSISS